MSDTGQPNLLSYLRPEECCDLLQPLDEPQTKGIGRHINGLPQIVVCGERTSGKSSVLEAISGIPFPVHHTYGTKLPMELTLYCGPRRSTKLTIRADPRRPECDIQRLDQIRQEFACGLHDLEHIVLTAELFLGIYEFRDVFQDVICIDICNPGQPHLVLIDLPGIPGFDGRNRRAPDARTAMNLVQEYMRNPSTIIVAALPAWEQFKDLLLPKACELADPTGSRTLSVITKPDVVPLAAMEKSTILRSLIEKNVKLRHNWYILSNTRSSGSKLTLAQRDAQEKRFFSQSNWHSNCPGRLGAEPLRIRIRQMLRDQVSLQLQSVAYRCQKQLSMYRYPLKHYRISHELSESQRSFLLEIGSKFGRLIKHAVQGHLKDDFLLSSTKEKISLIDLRTMIDGINSRFIQQMRSDGHTAEIVDREQVLTGRKVSRRPLVDKVERLLEGQKKFESFDAFISLAVKTLFKEQAIPWGKIINGYKQEVTNAACNTVGAILGHICRPATATAMGQHMGPRMVELVKTLDQQLLDTQKYFTDKGVVRYIELYHSSHGLNNHIKLFDHNVSKIRNTIHERNLHHNLKPYTYQDEDQILIKGEYNTILKIISDSIDKPKPDRRTCLDATLIMEEYYNDVLPKIITHITKGIVEESFLAQLPSLFDSSIVTNLDTLALQSIAGVREPSPGQSIPLVGKIATLERVLLEIKAFEKHSMAAKQQQSFTPRSTSAVPTPPPTSLNPFRSLHTMNPSTVHSTSGRVKIPLQAMRSPRTTAASTTPSLPGSPSSPTPTCPTPATAPSSSSPSQTATPTPPPPPITLPARFSIMDILADSTADTTAMRAPFVQQRGASPAYTVPIGTPPANRSDSSSSSADGQGSTKAEAGSSTWSGSRSFRLGRRYGK